MLKRRQQQELERKRRAGELETPERKERRMRAIYGRTTEDMAEDNRARMEVWMSRVDDRQSTVLLSMERTVDGPKFRPDRRPSQELGLPNLSSMRELPKAAYKGGGLIDMGRTQSIPPRPATAFTSLLGAEVARVVNPPYSNPATEFQTGFPMRARAKELEKGPPMRYKPRTETERIREVIAARPFTAAGRWEPASPLPPFAKTEHKQKWVATAKFKAEGRCANTEVERRTGLISGERAPSPIALDQPWGERAAFGGRERDKSLERSISAKEFRPLVRPDPLRRSFREPISDPLLSRSVYSQSMRDVRAGMASRPGSVVSRLGSVAALELRRGTEMGGPATLEPQGSISELRATM